MINDAFNEVVHWRHKVLSDKQSTAFVTELGRLYQAYADGSTLECIALKVTTMFQCKNHMQKVNQKSIQIAWNGNYLCEKVATSIHFLRRADVFRPTYRPFYISAAQNTEKKARVFSQLMFEDKIHTALRYISRDENGWDFVT